MLSSVSVFAGEKEDAILAKMAEAYGGETFTSATSITIRDDFKRLYWDQGAYPDFTEINKNNIEFTIDYKGKRKSLTAWEKSGRGTRLTKTVFDGEKGRIYDLYNKTFDDFGWLTYANAGAYYLRFHDTLLARLALSAADSVQFVGQSVHQGAAHDKLTVKTGNGPELTLHINQSTGLISKMTRMSSQAGEISYLFTSHKETDGVTYAADMQYSIAGQPEMISVARSIAVNPSLEHMFSEPQGFKPRGETIDTSDMTVRELTEGVYLAGQGYTFSLFVDTGEYFIGAGGNPGLAARFDAVQKHVGGEKPLRYQVVTHHHSDHIDGMKEVAELGTIFICTQDHMAPVQETFAAALPADRFLLVNGKTTVADGAVELYELASSHSAQNLLFYVPAAKVMFTADHFSSDLKTALPNADKGTVMLRKAIQKWQLDVERFTGAHGARVLTIADLHKVADSYSGGICPKDVSVCKE